MQQKNQPKRIDFSHVSGLNEYDLKKTLRQWDAVSKEYFYLTNSDSTSGGDYAAFASKYPSFVRRSGDGWEFLIISEYLGRVLNTEYPAIKFEKKEIYFPPSPGVKRVCGLLIPWESYLNLIFDRRKMLKNIAARLNIYKQDGDLLTVRIQVNLDHMNNLQPQYPQLTGTYELGEAVKDSIGLTLDLDTSDYSQIYDPSSEFEP